MRIKTVYTFILAEKIRKNTKKYYNRMLPQTIIIQMMKTLEILTDLAC